MLHPIPYGHEIRASCCDGCGSPIDKDCRRGPARLCKREFLGGSRKATTEPAPTTDEINRLIKAAATLATAMQDDSKGLIDVSDAALSIKNIMEGKGRPRK